MGTKRATLDANTEFDEVDTLDADVKFDEVQFDKSEETTPTKGGELPLREGMGNAFGVPDFKESTIMADGSIPEPVSKLKAKIGTQKNLFLAHPVDGMKADMRELPTGEDKLPEIKNALQNEVLGQNSKSLEDLGINIPVLANKEINPPSVETEYSNELINKFTHNKKDMMLDNPNYRGQLSEQLSKKYNVPKAQIDDYLTKLNDSKQSIRENLSAIALNPKNDKAYSELGNDYFNIGEYDQAEKVYMAAMSANPNSKGAKNGLGSVALAKKDYPTAVQVFSELSQTNPNTDNISKLATAVYGTGDFQTAYDLANKAVTAGGDMPDSYALKIRATANAALGNNAQSVEDLKASKVAEEMATDQTIEYTNEKGQTQRITKRQQELDNEAQSLNAFVDVAHEVIEKGVNLVPEKIIADAIMQVGQEMTHYYNTVDALKGAAKLYSEGGKSAILADELARAARVGFGAMTALQPEVQKFMQQIQVGEMVLPSQAIGMVMQPISMMFTDENSSNEAKNWAQVADIPVSLLIFHGLNVGGKKGYERAVELGDKIKKNLPLTKNEFAEIADGFNGITPKEVFALDHNIAKNGNINTELSAVADSWKSLGEGGLEDTAPTGFEKPNLAKETPKSGTPETVVEPNRQQTVVSDNVVMPENEKSATPDIKIIDTNAAKGEGDTALSTKIADVSFKSDNKSTDVVDTSLQDNSSQGLKERNKGSKNNKDINEPTNPTNERGTTSTDSNLPETSKVEQVQADSKKAETDSKKQVEEQVGSGVGGKEASTVVEGSGGVGGEVEGTAKALEEVAKTKPTLWEKIKEAVKNVGKKLGIISNADHINNFNTAKAEWDKLSSREKKLKRADYELDDLHHTEGGYYKVGNSLIDLDLNSNHLKLLLENNKFLNVLNKLGVTKIHGENRPAEEMFAHYSDGKIHLNNNSAFENIRQVTNAMSHELGHHEWTKLTKEERDYVRSLPLETGMAKHYEAQEKSGKGKETSASLQEENFADYVMQYFQGKLYGDEALLNKIPTKLRELFDNKYSDLLKDNEHSEIAEAYHKAKADGTNPELVKAVEQSIKETTKAETPTTNTGVVEGSVGVGGDVELTQEQKVNKTTKALDGIDKADLEFISRKENNRRKGSFYEKAKGILFKGFGGNASIISDKFGSKYKYFTDNPDYAKSFSLEKEYLSQKGKVEKYETDYKKEFNTNEKDYNNEVLKYSGKKSINDLTSKDFDNFNDKLKADGYDVVNIKRNEPLIPSEAYRGHSADIRNVEVEEHLILNDKAIKKIADQPLLLENNAQSIAEAYHKAKADGTNPELVKAVEQSLPTQEVKAEQVDSKGVPETQDSGTQKVDISTLNKGDEFYSDGEKYKFISKEEDGRVTVRTKSGTLRTTDIESFKDATKDSSKSGTPKTEENANNKSNSETKTLKGNEGENIADKESQNDKAGEGDGGVKESDIGVPESQKSAQTVKEKNAAKVVEKYDKGKTALEKAQEEGDQFDTPQQADEHIAAHSENPMEIAEAYLRLDKTESADYKSEMIDSHGITMTEQEFNSLLDKNLLTPKLKKQFVREKVRSTEPSIDVKLQELSSIAGVEITVEDLVDHIRHSEMVDEIKKVSKKDTQLRTDLKTNFDKLTGEDLTPKLAKKLVLAKLTTENLDRGSLIKEQVASKINEHGVLTIEDAENLRGFPLSDEEVDLIIKYIKDNEKGNDKQSSVSNADNSKNVGGSEEITVNAKAQAEYDQELKDLNEKVDKAKEAYDKAVKKINKDGNVLFENVMGEEADVQHDPEAAIKPFKDKIAEAESNLKKFEADKENFLKKYDVPENQGDLFKDSSKSGTPLSEKNTDKTKEKTKLEQALDDVANEWNKLKSSNIAYDHKNVVNFGLEKALLKLGKELIKAGFTNFKDFAKEILDKTKDFGEPLSEEHLKNLWNDAVRENPLEEVDTLHAAKNASIEAKRKELGFDPILSKLKTTAPKMLAEAIEIIAEGKVETMVEGALATKRFTFTAPEQIAIDHVRDQLHTEYVELTQKLITARESADIDGVRNIEGEMLAKRYKIDQYDTVLRNTGTTSAQVLAMRRAYVDKQLTSATILSEMAASAKDGKVPDELVKLVEKTALERDVLKADVKKLEEQIAEKDAANAQAIKEFEAELQQARTEQAQKANKRENNKKPVNKEREAEKARLREILGIRRTANALFNPENLLKKEFYQYHKLIFEDAVGDFRHFTKEMVKDFGSGIKEHLPKLFKDSGGTEEQINAAKKTDIELNGEFEILKQKAILDADGEFHEGLKGVLDKMFNNRVEAGETDYKKNVQSIYDALEKDIPNLDKNDLGDLIGGYGKFRELTKDPVKLLAAEGRRNLVLDAKIREVNQGKLPKRNGQQRAEKTKAERDKETAIAKGIREKGLTPEPTAEEQANTYKSELESYHRSLDRQIEDYDAEITSGVKKERNVGIKKSEKFTDAESKRLEAERDRVKRIRDAKFKIPQTPAEKKIESLRKQIEDVISGTFKKKEQSEPLTDTEKQQIKDLQKELDKAKIDAGLKDRPLTPEEKQIEKLQNQLDDIYAGITKEAKDKKIDSQAVKDLKDEIEKAKELFGLKASKPLEGESTVNAIQKEIDGLNTEIEDLQAGAFDKSSAFTKEQTPNAKNGVTNFKTVKGKVEKAITPEIQKQINYLKGQREALQEQKNNLLPQRIKDLALINKDLKGRQRRFAALSATVEAARKDPTVLDPKVKRKLEILSNDPEVNAMLKKLDEKNQAIKKQESELIKIKEEWRLANRSTLEIVGDMMNAIAREGAISNPAAIPKIFSSGLLTQLARPIENLIGVPAMQMLPKKVREAATIEGKFNPTIEGKAYAQFFNGKNWADAWEKMKTGKHREDKLYGEKDYPEKYIPFTNPINGKVYKIDVNLSGRMHAFSKTVPYKMGYERSRLYAYEDAIKNHPEYFDTNGRMTQEAQVLIESQAYFHSLADAFLQKNKFSSDIRAWINKMEHSKEGLDKVGAFFWNNVFKVLNVSANYFSSSLDYLPLVGNVRAQFAARSNIEMTAERANRIARQNKRSVVGLGLFAIGAAMPSVFGGFGGYDERNKEGVKAGEVNINGYQLPHWLTHTPFLMPFQLGATVGNYMRADSKDKDAFKSFSESMKGIIEANPFAYTFQTFTSALNNEKKFSQFAFDEAFGQFIPFSSATRNIGQWRDTDSSGNPIKREPSNEIIKGFIDRTKIATGINRKDVGISRMQPYNIKSPEIKKFLEEKNINITPFEIKKGDNGEQGTTVKGVFVKLTPEQVKKVDELTEKYTMEEIELRMKNADIPLEINEQGLEIPSSELKPRLNSQNIDIKKEIGEIKTRAKERAIMNLGYLKPDDIIDKSIEKQIKKIDELD